MRQLCRGARLGLGSSSSCEPTGCECDLAPEREVEFKQAILDLLEENVFPSGGAVLKKLGKGPGKNLNGERTRWRREVLLALGWSPPGDGMRGRWRPG